MSIIAGTASAIPAFSQTCDTVALQAAKTSGVPKEVLLSITRTETGRGRGGKLQPWPWTVNMEGKGVWFEAEAEARAYVLKHFRAGARSFDVGCFQINYRWHGKAFASIEAMFDPQTNANYAAKYLKSLHAEFGNWVDAAGAYHSRTPQYADRYKARFNRIMAGLGDINPTVSAPPVKIAKPPTQPRLNTFPLLQAGVKAPRLGSLVPLGSQGGAKPLFSQGG